MLEDADSEMKCTDTFYCWNTGTLSILSVREKFSSDTETVVGSLLSLALYFSWWHILVGRIFWVCL